MTGNFGHFFVYAPKDKYETRDYGTARYGMEVQRLMSVLGMNTTMSTTVSIMFLKKKFYMRFHIYFCRQTFRRSYIYCG